MDYALAFAAGFLSFLTPCVLPLIPAYLGYIVGSTVADARHAPERIDAVLKTLCFAAGFSVVFVALGISVSSVSKLFAEHLRLMQQIGGVLIVLFGLHMTGLLKWQWLYREKRWLPDGKRPGGRSRSGSRAGALLLGMAFAVGWTPCIGPILSSILLFAGSMETIGKGTALLALYAAGLATPFVLSSLLVGSLPQLLRRTYRWLPAMSVVSGALVIAMGVLVFTDRLEWFGRYSGF